MTVPRLVIGGKAEAAVLTARMADLGGGAPTAVAELGRGDHAGARSRAVSEVIRVLVGAADDVPSRLVVELRPPIVQLRTLRGLPPVPGRDLPKLVREQRERFFRAASDASIVSARWMNRKQGETIANVALAESDVLESIEAVLAGYGVEVQDFLATRDDEDEGLSLVTPAMASARARAGRHAVLGALALVAAGWLAPPVVYMIDLVRDHDELQVELTQVDSSLARLDSLDARMSAFAEFASAFRRQSADSAWASAAMADIAFTLPANVHLHAMRVERGGATELHVHSSEGPQARDSILARWPSSRIEGDSISADFTVDLGGES